MNAIPSQVLLQHTAILGKTGSGKTTTAKLVIEQVVAADHRVCVLDPIKSDWWGITSSADGKKPGLPFHILGGPRGHVPLHASAGRAIAEIVAGGSLPHSIIDMADFEPGGQAQFFTHFAPMLLRRMRGVLYLVIEEAHLFAPKERAGIGAENLSIHWAKTLATAGRSKGVRLVLVTQRTQALHNALLGSCDTVIAHRMTAPADQEPVIKWLIANVKESAIRTQVTESLSGLKTGSGWLCSSEARIFELKQFPRPHTFDNTATPTGNAEELAVKTAAVDLDKLRSIIGDAVKDAEADDPKILHARIRELSSTIIRLERERGETISRKDLEEARRSGREEGQRIATAAIGGTVHGVIKAGEEFMVRLRGVGEAIEQQPRREGATPPTGILKFERRGVEPAKRGGGPEPRLVAHVSKAAAATSRSDGRLSVGQRTVLTALIQYQDGLTREQLTVLAGYKRSTRDLYLQELTRLGLVARGAGDRIVATSEGIAALPDAQPLPTGEALQRHWLDKLPAGERKVLEVLLEARGEPVSREELSERSGYLRSTRDLYVQQLARRQLVTTTRGEVAASEELFR